MKLFFLLHTKAFISKYNQVVIDGSPDWLIAYNFKYFISYSNTINLDNLLSVISSCELNKIFCLNYFPLLFSVLSSLPSELD